MRRRRGSASHGKSPIERNEKPSWAAPWARTKWSGVGPQQDVQLSGSRIVGVLDELGEDLEPVGRECLGAVQRALGHLAAAAQPLIEKPDGACRFFRGRHLHFRRCIRISQKRVYRSRESVHVPRPSPLVPCDVDKPGVRDGSR